MPEPNEDRDVVVHRMAITNVGSTPPTEETIWSVWVGDVKIFETRDLGESARVARAEATARSVRAWIYDSTYPLIPLPDESGQ